MPESPTRHVGMDVPKDSSAVASVARDHDAQVIDRGTIGTRPADIDQRSRQLPSQGQHLVVVAAAGPCGDWRYRYLRQKGSRPTQSSSLAPVSGWGACGPWPHKAP
jgi:hypothetical protein